MCDRSRVLHARTHALERCAMGTWKRDVHQLPPAQPWVASAPACSPGSAPRPRPAPAVSWGATRCTGAAGRAPAHFPAAQGGERERGRGPAARQEAVHCSRAAAPGREFPAPLGHKRRKQRPRSGRWARGLGGRRKRGPRSADPGIRRGAQPGKVGRAPRPGGMPGTGSSPDSPPPEPAFPHM